MTGNGHPIVIVTSPTIIDLPVGTIFRMLGDTVLTIVDGDQRLFAWQGKSGRPPTAHEQSSARGAYSAAGSRRQREQQPDDELDDAAAIEACWREQEREPVNLLARVASPSLEEKPRQGEAPLLSSTGLTTMYPWKPTSSR